LPLPRAHPLVTADRRFAAALAGFDQRATLIIPLDQRA
jgi:hypothetical protein